MAAWAACGRCPRLTAGLLLISIQPPRPAVADERFVSLDTSSDPELLPLGRHFVQQAALQAGFEERESRRIMLAVDEACTNIIRHSYRGDVSQRIIITCRWEPGERLEVSLKDFGEGANPAFLEQFRKDDITEPGGLGLCIMRQVMDDIQYDPECGDGVELKMLKHIRPPKEQ